MKFQGVVIFLLALIFLSSTSFLYLKKAHSFRFVDEEYNFAIGKYLLQDEKLYDDLITNHQPLTHIFSYQLQKFTQPNSIYLLVSKHRQAMIIWSAGWYILLIFYFGAGGLLFAILFELTKIQLLGNLFLAESLVVYPLVFLIGIIFFLNRRLGLIELIFSGICFGLAMFLLGPIWPALAVLILILTLKQGKNFGQSLIYLGIGVLIITLYISQFSSAAGYFKYYLLANLTYTVPSYQSESFFLTAPKSVLSPLLVFLPNPQTPTLVILKIVIFLVIINSLIRRNFKQLIPLIFISGLLNIRFISPGTEGYSGFHILPWYGSVIFICMMVLFKKIIFVYLILGLIVVVFGFNFAKGGLLTKSNPINDYKINYSTFESVGEAVKIMRSSKDTLFVSPDNWLIYWQSDTNHFPKLFGYYAWMAGVPYLHQAILQQFEKNPPTYLYCENCQGLDLKKYLYRYREIKKNGGSTMLYVLNSKIRILSSKQIKQLNYYNFSF